LKWWNTPRHSPSIAIGQKLEVSRGVDCYTRSYPLGVVAGITPFNFLAMVPMWMFPLAIASGNTFLLKPSEQTPLTSMRMVELLLEAGLPENGTDRYVEMGRENLSTGRTTMSYHHDGAFAPLMKVPALAVRNGNLFKVTSDIPDDQMSLAEPLGCCMNAHSRLGIGLEDTVAVIGAGPIGIMHTCLARRARGHHRRRTGTMSPSPPPASPAVREVITEAARNIGIGVVPRQTSPKAARFSPATALPAIHSMAKAESSGPTSPDQVVRTSTTFWRISLIPARSSAVNTG